MFEMYIEATVRGYHAYLDNPSVRIGEILACEMELDSSHDKYTVAILQHAKSERMLCLAARLDVRSYPYHCWGNGVV